MKRFQYLLLVMLTLLLFSCNEKSKTLKLASSTINGPFGECFEVVSRDYKVVGNQLNVEFLRIQKGMPDAQIVVEFLDDANNVLGTSDLNVNGDDFKFLLANKKGESSTLAFEMGNINPTWFRIIDVTPQDANNEAPKIIVKTDETEEPTTEEDPAMEEELDEAVDVLELVKEDEEGEESEPYDEEEEDKDLIDAIEESISTLSTTSSSSGSKDVDKLLDDYESFVNHYIEFYKKAQKGDIAAIAEYAAALEKAEKLDKELEKAKGDFTVAQMQRLLKIQQKMAGAALDSFDQFDGLQF